MTDQIKIPKGAAACEIDAAVAKAFAALLADTSIEVSRIQLGTLRAIVRVAVVSVLADRSQ